MKSSLSSLSASLMVAAPLCALALCLTSLASCGAGTAAAVSGGGGSSGGNAPPSIAGFSVSEANNPHDCRVQFTLRDPEGNAASVELLYEVPGSPPQLISSIEPVAGIPPPPSNPASLAASASGVLYAFHWNFASEALLPDDGGFVDGARVFARLEGTSELLPGANVHSGIGNDPPQVVDAQAPKEDEVVGIAAVPFTVADSSSDAISIRVEFDIVGDAPDTGWRIARPAGIPASQPTPELAFGAVVAAAEGEDLVFFWNTNFDLADLERDAVLRFMPSDEVAAGDAVSTPVFHVDNNAEPIATVSEGALLLNPDQRAGIPIVYTVRDEESDEVHVVFQWKRPDESFPPLPDTPAEINAILADPVQRQALHICTEYPTWVEGRVVPIDSTHVRLPELATTASSILAHGLVGRELEILRASKVPKPIAATWASNPLNHPVAALPIGDGIEALVLDRASLGAWRLRQIDLATGVVKRELVSSSPGEPDALAFERDRTSVLVASTVAGEWRVARVRFSDGSLTPLVAFDGSTEPGDVRGIASLGTSAALITLGSALVRVDWLDPTRPTSTAILDGLATPWGVVLDPLNTNRIYLAERDARTDDGIGRVLSIRLDTLETHAISEQPIPILEDVFEHIFFDHPRALALDRAGARLLVITRSDPFEGTQQLQALDLGRAGLNRTFQITSGLPEDSASIATGAEGLLLLALTSEDDLAVGGGIEQRRTIEEFELAPRVAHVSAIFSPALSVGQRFRVRAPSRVLRPTPSGSRGTFVWDSEDLAEAGAVKFRAVPMDAERGVDGATEASKVRRSPLDTEPVALGNASVTDFPVSVVAADLDGDGDLDLASANSESDTLTIFFQERPGVFGTTPLSLGDESVTSIPVSVAAADLDSDGDLDLVSANSASHTLTVFFQTSPGVFGSTPLSLGSASVTRAPFSVTAADLDGDGDLDLASANADSHTLTVFFQESPGVFGATPLSLGNASVTSYPISVTAADLDGDGDLDLASANSGSSTLTVFFQESPGVFGSTPLSLGNFSVTYGPRSITAADLDGDGDLDLASANESFFSNTLTVFFQESPGVFSSTPLSLGNASVTGNPISVTAADLDGDGDLDLASANNGSNTLTVFFQESPGVFGSTPLSLGDFSVTNQPQSVTAADLDGDGDLDLASANRFSSTLTVFWNNH